MAFEGVGIGPLDKALFDFIADERGRYVIEANNRFAISLLQVARYLQFLSLIEARFSRVNQQVANAFARRLKWIEGQVGERQLTADEMREFEAERDLHVELHLEIESYFLFAKIALDKGAHFIENYFGQVRGASLRSHSGLCQHWEVVRDSKSLLLPAGFSDLILRLQEAVSDYRDKRIAHLQNPRALFGTGLIADTVAVIRHNVVRRQPGTGAPQPLAALPIPQVHQLMTEYVKALIVLVERNRERSRFEIKAGAAA